MIMYSFRTDRIVCFRGLHSHKGHHAQQANEGDVGCDLGWISPEPHEHVAKTNSRWWFASCLWSLWPASRLQPRDPQHSEGGAEESCGPPTGYKTRGGRKPSDSKHTWSKEAEWEGRKEGAHYRARESNSCHRRGAVCAVRTETDKYRNKGPQRRSKEEKKDEETAIWLQHVILNQAVIQRINWPKNWPWGCEVFLCKPGEKNKRDLGDLRHSRSKVKLTEDQLFWSFKPSLAQHHRGHIWFTWLHTLCKEKTFGV